MNGNVTSRALHDVGLAAWFGGTLAGAVGFNGGGATAKDPAERTQIASNAWAKWTPVNAAAIGAHLIGCIGQIQGNRSRLEHQSGTATAAAVKTALTVAALGATGYARVVGKQIETLSPQAPTEGVTEPSAETPADLAAAQKTEKTLQWVLPALTGAIVVVSAFMGEQQRPASVASGVLGHAKGLLK